MFSVVFGVFGILIIIDQQFANHSNLKIAINYY
jgi:hypothetical protein